MCYASEFVEFSADMLPAMVRGERNKRYGMYVRAVVDESRIGPGRLVTVGPGHLGLIVDR
jgi:hypothetical protein